MTQRRAPHWELVNQGSQVHRLLLIRNLGETSLVLVAAARNIRNVTGGWARIMVKKAARLCYPCYERWDLSRRAFGVLVVGLTAGACFGGETDQAIPVSVVSERVVAPGSTDTIEVALLEYAIGIPTKLSSGEVILKLSNQGFEDHNLRFFLSNMDAPVWETESDVAAGETRLVELELGPGQYTVICDVAGHDTRGMSITINVEAIEGD